MTPYKLLANLREGLTEHLTKFYKLPAQYQDNKKVSIFIQDTPNADDETIYPMVLIELLGVEDTVEESTASILITIGTFGDDCKDFFNLCEKVREYLNVTKIVGGEYTLNDEISFGVAEKQVDGFYFGNFYINYNIMRYDYSFFD